MQYTLKNTYDAYDVLHLALAWCMLNMEDEMSAYEESEIEASFDYCGNFMNVDKARAELLSLRAAAAEGGDWKARYEDAYNRWQNVKDERDRMQAVVDAQAAIIKEQEQQIEYITNREATIKHNYETAALAQAAQLEQAREAIDAIVELGKDSHDVGDDIRWREMWHVAVEEVETRSYSNTHASEALPVSAFAAIDKLMTERGDLFNAAPEVEERFDSAQKYREALERIEAVWVGESVTDEHGASLKMYTIAARALNNADDEQVYNAPEAEEATK